MQAIHYVEIGGFVAEAFGIWLLFSEVRLAHEFEKRHLLHLTYARILGRG